MTRFACFSALSKVLSAVCLASAASAQVQAFVVHGNLFVRGSAAGESLTLHASGDQASVLGNFGTTVNGLSQVDLSGVTGEVLVSMDGGNDSVFVSDSTFPGGMQVRLGSGDDLFFAARNTFNGDLEIDGGSFASAGELIVLGDPAGVGNVIVGDLEVDVRFATVVVLGSTVYGESEIESRQGGDLIQVDGCEFFGRFEVESGGGNDTIRLGSDAGGLGNTFHGCLEVESGHGGDIVRLGSTAGGATTIEGNADIRTGSGDDQVFIQNTTFERRLRARGGHGLDSIELQGAGFANSLLDGLSIEGFETVL